MTLISQPTSAPTRKMTAVVVSGLITAILQIMLTRHAPEFPATQLLSDFDIWIQALVMMGFGYMTKERA